MSCRVGLVLKDTWRDQDGTSELMQMKFRRSSVQQVLSEAEMLSRPGERWCSCAQGPEQHLLLLHMQEGP